jgi:hypothetical protein
MCALNFINASRSRSKFKFYFPACGPPGPLQLLALFSPWGPAQRTPTRHPYPGANPVNPERLTSCDPVTRSQPSTSASACHTPSDVGCCIDPVFASCTTTRPSRPFPFPSRQERIQEEVYAQLKPMQTGESQILWHIRVLSRIQLGISWRRISCPSMIPQTINRSTYHHPPSLHVFEVQTLSPPIHRRCASTLPFVVNRPYNKLEELPRLRFSTPCHRRILTMSLHRCRSVCEETHHCALCSKVPHRRESP